MNTICYNWHRNCNCESNSNDVANKLTGDLTNETRKIFQRGYARVQVSNVQSNARTQYKISNSTIKNSKTKQQTKYTGQEINPLKNISSKKGKSKNNKGVKCKIQTKIKNRQWNRHK